MKSHKSVQFIIHAFFWLFYVIALNIFDESDYKVTWVDKIHLDILVWVFTISYINYCVLLPYFISRKSYLLYTITIAGMVLLTTMIHCYFKCSDSKLLCFSIDIWIIAIPVVSISLIWMISQFIGKQKELEKSHQDRVELELKFLKSQINPHVLFNSLNTIYAQAIKENEAIADMILMLSENLKYVLNQSNDTLVDLEKDITFIENYLEFQKLRTKGINNIIYKKEIDSYNHSIAPLILIDLIENAFKYSTFKDNELSDIIITIVIKNGNLHFFCKNEVSTTHQSENVTTTQIGLKNLKQRLNLIYKNNFTLKINDDDGMFVVDLKIDLG